MSTQNQETKDSFVAYHPDSRSMRLTPKAEWPKNGLTIRSHETPAFLKVLWRPESGEPPWLVQTYLEWGTDWNDARSCRYTTDEILLMFRPSKPGEEPIHSVGRFRRSGDLLSVPATHQLEVRNGDPICQISLMVGMVKAVEELVEQHDPKPIQATA